jgi:hypothetical protein
MKYIVGLVCVSLLGMLWNGYGYLLHLLAFRLFIYYLHCVTNISTFESFKIVSKTRAFPSKNTYIPDDINLAQSPEEPPCPVIRHTVSRGLKKLRQTQNKPRQHPHSSVNFTLPKTRRPRRTLRLAYNKAQPNSHNRSANSERWRERMVYRLRDEEEGEVLHIRMGMGVAGEVLGREVR